MFIEACIREANPHVAGRKLEYNTEVKTAAPGFGTSGKAVAKHDIFLREEATECKITRREFLKTYVIRFDLRHIEALEASPTLYNVLRISRALGVDLSGALDAK